jgi:uncharacterized membrane protein YjjB (DUF3815 family)
MTVETLLLNALFGFVATLGFAVLFNVPRYTLLWCAVVGAGGHLIRYVLRNSGVSNEVATFFGAFFVGVVGYAFAVRYQMPRTAFTVSGIITMVPGIQAYEVMVLFSQGNIPGGLEFGVRAGLVTGAIASGLGAARIITDVDWRHLRGG